MKRNPKQKTQRNLLKRFLKSNQQRKKKKKFKKPNLPKNFFYQETLYCPQVSISEHE